MQVNEVAMRSVTGDFSLNVNVMKIEKKELLTIDNPMLDQYDDIIWEQLVWSVVEKAPAKVTGKEFYMPHRAAIRENAESTELQVVYDASARAYDSVPSLSECLHTGLELEVLRFTTVVFGLAPSPFLLNAVIQQHLESVQSEYPGTVQEIKNSRYVDLITGDTTVEGAQQLKHHAADTFNRAKFALKKMALKRARTRRRLHQRWAFVC